MEVAVWMPTVPIRMRPASVATPSLPMWMLLLPRHHIKPGGGPNGDVGAARGVLKEGKGPQSGVAVARGVAEEGDLPGFGGTPPRTTLP
jgi:hypothetical protein